MTHFETLLVESIRDLAKEVHANNTLCARVDERLDAHIGETERRLRALEVAPPSPPSSSRRGRVRVTAKEAGLGATALVAIATALLQALSGPAAPAAPRPTAPAVAAGAP